MPDAIVVGAGLFGQIITKALRAHDRDVVMLDANHAMAGSGPAACLMKPSWFSSLGRDVYKPSLRLLNELYDVQEVKFAMRPRVCNIGARLAYMNVPWIRPATILAPIPTYADVSAVVPGRVETARGQVYEAPLIVVATGIWTERLLPQYRQQGQMGAAFLWKDPIDEPFIHPYAPYRQIVAFNRGDGLWVGDGTSIKQENWTADRLEISKERCADSVGRHRSERFNDGPIVLQGIRPYAKGHRPCLLEEVTEGLWVASGGAKNGTIAAGYCAHVIRRQTS